MGGWDGLIYVSKDKAQSWSRLSKVDVRGFNLFLFADPQISQILYAISPGFSLQRSVDGGNTWQKIGDGLPKVADSGSDELPVLTIAIDPTDSNIIYLGTGGFTGNGHGVYKSTDGGLTFSAANRGMIDYRIAALAVDPLHPQTIYAGSDSGELFKTTDGGETWSDLSKGLESEYGWSYGITWIYIDSANPQNVYIQKAHEGVSFSNDWGQSWIQLPKPNVDNYSVTAMAVLYGEYPIMVLGLSEEGGWRFSRQQP
jgi:photosystem II stability/assembly factor-like uncharacterized protein